MSAVSAGWERWKVVLFAVALVAATLGFRLWLGPESYETPMLTLFVLPVVVSAKRGGALGGWAAAVSSAGAATYLLELSEHARPAMAHLTNHLAPVVALLMAGLAVGLAFEHEHQSRRSLAASEAALRTEAARLQLFIEHAPASIAMFDRDMRYLAVSKRFYEDYRLDPAVPLVGRSHYEVFPDVPERWKAIHRRCLEGAVESADADPFDRVNGTRDWVRWEVLPWRDDHGTIGGLLLFSEVITEKRLALEERTQALARAEASAQQAQRALAELEAAFQVLGEAVYVFDPAGAVVFANDAALGMLGPRDVSTPLNSRFFEASYELLDTERRPLPRDAWPMRRVLRGESFANVTLEVARKGAPRGQFRRFSGAPVRDERGEQFLAVLLARDVTAEVEAAAALREEKERLDVTLQSIGDAVITTDARGVVTRLNPAAEEMTGWTAEDAVGRSVGSVFRVLEDATGQELPDVVGVVLREGVTVPLANHVALLRRDGSTCPVSTSAAPIRDAEGGRLGAVLVFRDQTRAHQAQRALELSEARFRQLFEVAAVGLAEVDATNGRFLRVNPHLAELLRYSPAELEGVSWKDVSPADEAEVDRALYQGLLERHEGFTREKRYLRKDGTEFWAQLSLSPSWQKGTRPTTLVAVVKDSTERKRADEAMAALAQSERRFRTLIEKSSDMLVVLNDRLRISLWSPSCADRLGWTDAEVLGRSAARVLHRDDWASAREAAATLRVAPGAVLSLTVRVRHRDGKVRTVRVNARNLLEEPAVRGIVLHMEDVTEQQLLQQQFEQAQKLESLGRLAGGVAHDFNNLITVILSCSTALKEDVAAGVPPSTEDIEEIHASGERAAALTRQLLAFARRQVVDPRPLEVNEVVMGTQKMLARLLGEDVRLVVELQPALPRVFADPGQLEQVIMNLAVNARDAMPKGGSLTLATHLIERPDQAEPLVALRVSDTGDGMSDEVKRHLFEPFFTTKALGRGTGLGLATVYGIVAQAGGQIRVDSTLGRGTTFELTFPGSSAASDAAHGAQRPMVVGGDETVLVVEDDAPVRGIVSRTLTEAGYRVLAVDGGERAIEAASAEKGPIHLVVTDVVMPGMDGRTLSEHLERVRPGLRVLYMSGYSHDHLAGVDKPVDLLLKPFTTHGLRERVRRALDRPRG